MQKQKYKKPLPKRKRIIRIDSPQEKATKARQENDRNRTIASYYFNEDPSIGNLVKGAYYWAKGNLLGDSEDPEDYKYITGEPPSVTGGPLKVTSSTGAKVLREVVGKRPQKAVEVVKNGIRDFYRGVAHGTKIGRREGADEAVKAMREKVSRAYKLGIQRGTQTAERTAKKTAEQKAQESIQEAQRKYKKGWLSGRKVGADIQRRWTARSAATTPSTPPPSAPETPSLGFWGNTKRVLWETKNNNFGNSYKWRNAGRVPLFLSSSPYILGGLTGSIPRYFEYAGQKFAKGYKAGIGSDNQPDTTENATSRAVLQSQEKVNPVQSDTVVPVPRNEIGPVTTSTQEELDSINKAWFGE